MTDKKYPMWGFFPKLLISALLICALPSEAKVVYEEGWEDGKVYNKSSLHIAGGCYFAQTHGYNSLDVTSRYVRDGQKALRLEARGDDKNEVCDKDFLVREKKTRNEIHYMNDNNKIGQIPHGREVWLSTSYYIPSNEGSFKSWWNSGERFIIFQLSGAGNSSTPEVHFMLGLRGKLDIEMTHSVTQTEKQIKAIEQTRFQEDKWNDVVVHWKRSWQSDGILQIWINGDMVVNKKGPNAIRDKPFAKVKTGIYFGTEKRKEDYVLYVDSLRLGDNNSSYEEVLGSSSLARQSPPVPPLNIEVLTN